MAKLIGLYHKINKRTPLQLRDRGFYPLFSDGDIAIFCQKSADDHNFFCRIVDGICLVLWGTIINHEAFDSQDTSDWEGENANFADKLIQVYVREGDLIFDHLDGSYALVLWDGNRKKLYLCRDDFGTKLLYYGKDNNGCLLFSTDLNELLKVIGKKDLSTKALFEYLRFLDISPPYTIYNEVFFLEPEKVLVAVSGRISLKNKGSGTRLSMAEANLSADPVECFEHLFREGLHKRIAETEKLGVFLSGGIDSALVCAIAAEIKNDIKVYTVGFEDPRFDESVTARRITGYLGVDHQVSTYTLDQDLAAFHEFVSITPSPFADPAIVPTFQCFKDISDCVDLVLDGTGADTLIGIMPARHIRFILKYSRHIPYPLRKRLCNVLELSPKTAGYSDLFSFEDAAELLIRWRGWSKTEISSLCKESCDLTHTMFYRIYNAYTNNDPYVLYSKLMGSLPDDRLHQCSSFFDLEVAFPFFDKKVQAYVRQLPLSYKYGKDCSKLLFRKVLAKYVPEEIWNRPKHGFDYPFERLLESYDFALVKTYLSPDALTKQGLFDSKVVERYVKRFIDGDNSVKFKIWGLVLFQGWYENYFRKL